jgi:copper chaperone CopZ
MFGSNKGKVKTTLTITDMECSMCEAHINEALRKALGVNSVKSSAREKETVILSDEEIPYEKIRKVIEETGYTLTGITSIKQ